jgi:hypothetical protein
VSSPFRLTEVERAGRYDLLVRATTLREPPVLSEAGLRLLLDAATAPRPPDELPAHLRPQLQRLITAGLAGGDGRLTPQARDIVKVIEQPAIWLRIEAAGGQPMTWTAWLSNKLAVIVARDGPADDYTLRTVIPGWVPVQAVRWLGIGPRDVPAGPRDVPAGPRDVPAGPRDSQASARALPARRPVLPMTTMLSWLDEPGIPPPGDDPVLAQIWAQPGRLWAIEVAPDGGRVLVLDAAEAGLWLVTGAGSTDDAGDVVLLPLPPRTFWRMLLTFIASASEMANASKVPSPAPAANRSTATRNDHLL